MAQKIKPNLLRLGLIENWSSRWFAKGRRVKQWLHEDMAIKEIIRKKIGTAGISKIDIERTADQARVTIKAARPGLVIGRGGKGIEELTKMIEKELKKIRQSYKDVTVVKFNLNVEELKRSEISAANVAQNIAWDLEKRMRFRRVIKKYLDTTMQSREVKGAKVRVSGRLDGADIARAEWLTKGSLPLQTLRANIDYGTATAWTTYGAVGVKVWIYKGEVFGDKDNKESNVARS